MSDMAARIAAAVVAGDVHVLATLAIELSQENSRLAGHAAALEQAQRDHEASDRARKDADAERKRLDRAGRPRKSTDVHGQDRTSTDVLDAPPSPPSPSLLPPGPPNNSSPTPSSPVVPAAPKTAVTVLPGKAARAKQPPSPWMGLMAKAWTLGTLVEGSATLLRPVVAAIGDVETARRLGAYCEATDHRYASVRDFVAKHAAFADDGAPLVENGWFTPAGERATR